jgi:hypothetical protein
MERLGILLGEQGPIEVIPDFKDELVKELEENVDYSKSTLVCDLESC